MEAKPITVDVVAASRQIPQDAFGDPWHRSTRVSAMALWLPLVTRDRLMREPGLVDRAW
ncbi:hypothetical protein [Geodermatophilus sp. DSM 44513]|uniref:hypothetical protein n=1 Tax=Geodermatophilus sp. DSM 44513 TaxID=1528104 RepID=UPI00126D9CE2|nr:hypothetical protein [Geodermatophilus sp. DSM 44513]WNV76835.1 hypothetical protein RTG05_06040 [Geodermatophilus sp. DSM 44513]